MNSNRIRPAVVCLSGAMLLCAGSAAMGQNTTSPSVSDKKFVQRALEGGIAEMQLGELAVQRGNCEDVKQFGQKIIDDHIKMGDQIRDVAQREGIKAPRGTTVKDQTLEAKLKGLSGESFDKAFIAAMVKDHRQDLAHFKREANAGNDTEIKDAASQVLQMISQHLKLAERIARNHNIAIGEIGQ
jgi:putative membrane protein